MGCFDFEKQSNGPTIPVQYFYGTKGSLANKIIMWNLSIPAHAQYGFVCNNHECYNYQLSQQHSQNDKKASKLAVAPITFVVVAV